MGAQVLCDRPQGEAAVGREPEEGPVLRSEENGDIIGGQKEKKNAFHVCDPQKKRSLVSGASLVCICAFGVAPLFLGLC